MIRPRKFLHTHTHRTLSKWTWLARRVVGSGEDEVVHPEAADSAIAGAVAVVAEVPAWAG